MKLKVGQKVRVVGGRSTQIKLDKAYLPKAFTKVTGVIVGVDAYTFHKLPKEPCVEVEIISTPKELRLQCPVGDTAYVPPSILKPL
jgi:hypothetical protein